MTPKQNEAAQLALSKAAGRFKKAITKFSNTLDKHEVDICVGLDEWIESIDEVLFDISTELDTDDE